VNYEQNSFQGRQRSARKRSPYGAAGWRKRAGGGGEAGAIGSASARTWKFVDDSGDHRNSSPSKFVG
jgi:hypothetical protein